MVLAVGLLGKKCYALIRLGNYNYGNSNAELNSFSSDYWGTTIKATVTLNLNFFFFLMSTTICVLPWLELKA